MLVLRCRCPSDVPSTPPTPHHKNRPPNSPQPTLAPHFSVSRLPPQSADQSRCTELRPQLDTMYLLWLQMLRLIGCYQQHAAEVMGLDGGAALDVGRRCSWRHEKQFFEPR